MQRLKIFLNTLKSSEIYYYTTLIFLFILSLNNYIYIVLFVLLLYILRRKINSKVLIIIMVLIFSLYSNEKNYTVTKFNNEKAIVKMIEENNYSNLIEISIKGRSYNLYSYENLEVGKIIYITGDVISYSETKIPFGFNAKRYYQNNNIYGSINNYSILKTNDKTIYYYLDLVKTSLLNKHSNETQLILNKLLFNNDTLPEEAVSIFKELNIIHLLNLSGMHIFVFLLIIKKINFKLNTNLKLQKVIEISFIFLVFIFSNFKVTILRILIYQIIKTIFKSFNIIISNYASMHLSFLLIVLLKPYLLFSQSLLLSFLIVNGIMLTKPFYDNDSYIIKSLKISFIVSLIILPFNNQYNILAVLIIPIISLFTIYLLYPLCLLTLIFNVFSIYLVAVFNFILLITNYINQNFNYLKITTGNMHNILILIYYCLLILIVLKSNFFKKVVYITALLVVVLTPKIKRTIINEQFYFLDVGQGDSFVYINKDIVIVVDAYRNVEHFLKNMGINKIDYLILSHSDADHSNEAQRLIDEFNVNNLVISKFDQFDLNFSNNSILVNAPYQLKINDITLNFFGPLKDYNNKNNNSLVFKFSTKKHEILFTGDILKEAEIDIANRFKNLLSADILKVAHHGSNSSSSFEFLKYVKPKHAIISYDINNKYGFPHHEALLNITKFTTNIYETGRDNTIIIYNNKIYKYSYLIMKKWWFIV